MNRKIIQFQVNEDESWVSYYALCDDGTLWTRDWSTNWKQITPIPADNEEKKGEEE